MNLVKEQGEIRADVKTRWKKGQSGNLKGRTPNEFSLTIAMQEYLIANPDERQAIVQRVVSDAKRGEPYAAKLAWSYLDGLPPASIDLTSKGEKLLDENIIVKSILSALGK